MHLLNDELRDDQGKFELKLVYPRRTEGITAEHPGNTNHWKQSNNPMADTVSDFSRPLTSDNCWQSVGEYGVTGYDPIEINVTGRPDWKNNVRFQGLTRDPAGNSLMAGFLSWHEIVFRIGEYLDLGCTGVGCTAEPNQIKGMTPNGDEDEVLLCVYNPATGAPLNSDSRFVLVFYCDNCCRFHLLTSTISPCIM